MGRTNDALGALIFFFLEWGEWRGWEGKRDLTILFRYYFGELS